MPNEEEVRAHQFNEAMRPYGLDLETIRAIVAAVKEYHEHNGDWPSATQVRALIVRPGV